MRADRGRLSTPRARSAGSPFRSLGRRGSHLVFADGVAPILEQGLATLWEDSYPIDGNLTPAPERALLTGPAA
ncbi:hypothetical protein [Lentzea sp.]|uniref:hypothetical protein n=1 Tax=Lentzea sp. TaxID=56099 RepID=UPI002BEC9431|nr:hypothetical protein [Lentzea sp.]HUQ58393.1 hypothetical protein [Lentzea sp.]